MNVRKLISELEKLLNENEDVYFKEIYYDEYFQIEGIDVEEDCVVIKGTRP